MSTIEDEDNGVEKCDPEKRKRPPRTAILKRS